MTQLGRFGSDIETTEITGQDAVKLAENAFKAGDLDLAADWIALAYAKFDRQVSLSPDRGLRQFGLHEE